MDVKRKGEVFSANLVHTNRRRLRSVLLRYLAMIARSSIGNCIFAGQSRTMMRVELVFGWSGQNLDQYRRGQKAICSRKMARRLFSGTIEFSWSTNIGRQIVLSGPCQMCQTTTSALSTLVKISQMCFAFCSEQGCSCTLPVADVDIQAENSGTHEELFELFSGSASRSIYWPHSLKSPNLFLELVSIVHHKLLRKIHSGGKVNLNKLESY